MKIVVCVNENKESQLALENAVEFVDGTDFELTLLHGINQKVNHENNGIIQESNENAHEKGEKLVENLKQDAINLAKSDIIVNGDIIGNEDSDPVHSIIEYIKSEDIDQIFIGHRAMDKKHEKLSFHKERIPPFTAGVNPTLADQSTDDTLAGYSTVIHNY
jgi:Universal stress protein family.